MTLEAGSRVGPYRVVEVLGQGGMASVYRAHDPGLERDVALKVLAAEFLRQQDFAERFRSEAKFSAMLEHPHIVPIHAFGIDDGVPWMAMRLIGASASKLLRACRVKAGRHPLVSFDQAPRHAMITACRSPRSLPTCQRCWSA